MPTEATEQQAIAIYALMARDPGDALDAINECTNLRVLRTLHSMLTHEQPGARTDHTLNAIMVGPVARRIFKLKVL